MGTFHHSVSQQNAKQFFIDTIFETGGYFFPVKLQNQNCFGPRGPASTQWSHPNMFCQWCPLLCTASKHERHA